MRQGHRRSKADEELKKSFRTHVLRPEPPFSWKGPKTKGHIRKGHREKHPENTPKTPWNTHETPWKYPENTLKTPWKTPWKSWNSWHSILFPYALSGYALCTFPIFRKMMSWIFGKIFGFSGVDTRVVFQKGGFSGTETGTRIHSDVPLERKPGTRACSNVPQNENRNEGTFAKTTLPPFCQPSRLNEVRNFGGNLDVRSNFKANLQFLFFVREAGMVLNHLTFCLWKESLSAFLAFGLNGGLRSLSAICAQIADALLWPLGAQIQKELLLQNDDNCKQSWTIVDKCLKPPLPQPPFRLSRHLKWPGPKSQKSSKRVFLGVCREVPENNGRKSKNTRFRAFYGPYIGPFDFLFLLRFRECPETPANGSSGRSSSHHNQQGDGCRRSVRSFELGGRQCGG